MDCTLIGGGNTIDYQEGFLRQDGIVIGAVKNVLYTQAVEYNIKLIKSIYDFISYLLFHPLFHSRGKLVAKPFTLSYRFQEPWFEPCQS